MKTFWNNVPFTAKKGLTYLPKRPNIRIDMVISEDIEFWIKTHWLKTKSTGENPLVKITDYQETDK